MSEYFYIWHAVCYLSSDVLYFLPFVSQSQWTPCLKKKKVSLDPSAGIYYYMLNRKCHPQAFVLNTWSPAGGDVWERVENLGSEA